MKKDHDSERTLLHTIIIYSVSGAVALIIMIILQFTGKPAGDTSSETATIALSSSAESPSAADTSVNSDLEAADSESASTEVYTEASSEASSTASYTEATSEATDMSVEEVSADDTASENATVITFKVVNCNAYINVRAKPDTSSQSLGQMNKDDEGEIIEQGDTWSLIKTNDDIYGYIQNKYMKTE